MAGHFHPKGKAPSQFTVEVLRQAGATLPFDDTRDLDEQAKGLIAPMPDLQIMADAGHVAWDMARFRFLDQQTDFDSIHPSLLRQSRLNNNYGLYEVIPGIFQVRGFDLSNITFVRGSTGWIVFDPLVTAEVVRAAWTLFQGSRGRRAAGLGGDLFPHPRRPLGAACAGSSTRRMYARARSRSSPRSTLWSSRSPRTSMSATR